MTVLLVMAQVDPTLSSGGTSAGDDAPGLDPTVLAALIAVAGTLLGAVVGRISARRSLAFEQFRLRTERFGSAAKQIGDESPAVRMAGVFAMAALADEWDQERQPCVDVLCGYMRLPPRRSGDGIQDGEEQVRRTIARVVERHLQEQADQGWSDLDFDFRGAWFPARVEFANGTFEKEALFHEAKFAGVVSFLGTTFNKDAKFGKAVFEDLAVFAGTTFKGEAYFSGAEFESTNFLNATFCNNIHFGQATLNSPIDLTTTKWVAKSEKRNLTRPDGSTTPEMPVEIGATAPPVES